MKKLIKLLKPYKFVVLALIIMLYGQVLCELYLPSYMGKMLDSILNNEGKSDIYKIGITMLALSISAGTIAITASFIISKMSAKLSMQLRHNIFTKVMSFSNDEIDNFSNSSLITRCTNDITQVQTFMQFGVRMGIFSAMMLIGGVRMAIITAPSLSWLIILACIAIAVCMIAMFSILAPKFKILQKLTDKISLVTRQHLTGLMVIRAFNTENYEKKKFAKANDDLTNTQLFTARAMSIMMPFMMLLVNFGTLAIVWISSKKIGAMTMQIGGMAAFMQYALHIVMSFMFLAWMYMLIPRAAVAAERIDEVLNTECSIIENKTVVKPNNFTVKFENVTYKYKDTVENAVENISFEAEPGKTTAIIGATGSGKSTLASLLMRFYDISEGKITLGGVDIRDMQLKELRENIGYIPQTGVLFSGTIKSNLLYGNESASDEEMRKAADIAQAIHFIERKSKKFDDEISQGGSNVSGGQKQRLSIARALAKNAPIYVFDDSFSALDFKTDAALRKALKNDLQSAVLIIVAQRVSTIKNAEQIIVLDGGKIVAKGTHNELLETCEEYREIAVSQGAAYFKPKRSSQFPFRCASYRQAAYSTLLLSLNCEFDTQSFI